MRRFASSGAFAAFIFAIAQSAAFPLSQRWCFRLISSIKTVVRSMLQGLTLSATRLNHIDGLRGIAALLVIIGHWLELFALKYMDAVPWLHTLNAGYLTLGRVGVVAFFCVSGFVIPFSFRGEMPLVNFVISRFFRLYPAYWVSLLLGVIVILGMTDQQLTPFQIAANVTMAQALAGQPDVLGVYWTLFVEIIFYGMCFLLFAAGRLHSTATTTAMVVFFLFVAIVGGLYRWHNPASDLPVGLPTYLAAMFFGTLTRLGTLEEDPLARRVFPLMVCLMVVGTLLANSLAYYHSENELVGWLSACVSYLLGIALFLLCVQRRWFDGPTLLRLGAISYSLYLFHPIALIVMTAVWDWSSGPFYRIVLTALYLALSIGMATLCQRWIETPMMAAGHRLAKAAERLGAGRRSANPAPAKIENP